MKRIVLLLIAILFLFPIHEATSQLAQYYRFDYYYPTVRISFKVGEFMVVHQGGAIDTLQLENFDFWRTLCGASLSDLSDSSQTSSFQSQSGDILSYFTDLLFHFSCYHDGAEILDTLFYTIQLIDDDSGVSLKSLDTIGVYPMTVLDSLDRAIINKDTTVLRTYTIPEVYAGMALSLKVGMSFSGPDSLAAICRNDRGSETGLLLSEQSIADWQYLEMLIDTLIAEGSIDTSFVKRVGQQYERLEGTSGAVRLLVSPNPAQDEIVVRLSNAEKRRPTDMKVLLFAADGKIVDQWLLSNMSNLRINVSGLVSGQYYVVPYADGRLHAGTHFTVVR